MNEYLFLIILLLFTNTLGFYLTYEYYNKNRINYSNYKNALRALAEYDEDLKEYLEKKEN